MFQLVIVVVLGGVIGGTANFLSKDPPEGQSRNWERWARLAFLGIAAALTVPLFLSLTDSTLITDILAEPAVSNSRGNVALLVVLGICIAAAFSSRVFLDTISQKLLEAATTAARSAEQAAEEATETVELLQEEVDRSAGTAEIQPLSARDDQSVEVPNVALSDEEKKTLEAASHLTTRTATGIARDAGLSRASVVSALGSLKRKDLVQLTRSQRTGGVRHQVTRRGIALLNRGYSS